MRSFSPFGREAAVLHSSILIVSRSRLFVNPPITLGSVLEHRSSAAWSVGLLLERAAATILSRQLMCCESWLRSSSWRACVGAKRVLAGPCECRFHRPSAPRERRSREVLRRFGLSPSSSRAYACPDLLSSPALPPARQGKTSGPAENCRCEYRRAHRPASVVRAAVSAGRRGRPRVPGLRTPLPSAAAPRPFDGPAERRLRQRRLAVFEVIAARAPRRRPPTGATGWTAPVSSSHSPGWSGRYAGRPLATCAPRCHPRCSARWA